MYRNFFSYFLGLFLFLSLFAHATASITAQTLLEKITPRQSTWIPMPIQKNPQDKPQHVIYIAPQKDTLGQPVKEMLFYPDGTLHIERDVTSNIYGWLVSEGIEVEYYPSGTLKHIALFHNNRIEGTTFTYHPNEKQARQMTYYKGIPEGTAYTWNEAGNLVGEEHYFRGLLHNAGKTPAFQKFNAQHQLIEAQHYFYGQAQGPHVCYNDQGTQVSTINYNKGKRL